MGHYVRGGQTSQITGEGPSEQYSLTRVIVPMSLISFKTEMT